MPRNDYVCDTCGAERRDFEKSVGGVRPRCPEDDTHGEMEWKPAFSRGRSLGFIPFDHEMDGVTHRITDIGQVRAIEAESLKRTANGEGSPTIFRAFNQNPSNYDKNVFGDAPSSHVPRPTRRGTPLITRGDNAPRDD